MISKSELQRLANREKVALGVLEKDYVLTEVHKALTEPAIVPEEYKCLSMIRPCVNFNNLVKSEKYRLFKPASLLRALPYLVLSNYPKERASKPSPYHIRGYFYSDCQIYPTHNP